VVKSKLAQCNHPLSAEEDNLLDGELIATIHAEHGKGIEDDHLVLMLPKPAYDDEE